MGERGRTVWLPVYESHFNLLFERRRKENWMASTCETRGRCSAATRKGKLTSPTKVSAGAVDDPSRRPCLRYVGVGGESRDRFVVEPPVAVVGAVDASSDDSDMVDSSRLTPTMAGYIPSTSIGGAEKAGRCSDRENMFLELGPWGQQTLAPVWRTMYGVDDDGPRGRLVVR